VGRQLDSDRELAVLAVDLELDRKASLAHLPDEGRQVVESRLRRERIAGVAAQHPDQAPHLGQRAAADPLDRREHLFRRRVPPVEDTPFCAGLYDHHRDVVRDRVVQLACDPRPLLHDRFPRGEVALPLGESSTTLAVADDAADEHHHDERDHAELQCVRE